MGSGNTDGGEQRPAGIFEALPMRPVLVAALDRVLGDPDRPPLLVLFLWGRNCPNCDIAKAEMARTPDRFRWPDVGWLHCNVYDDPEMATRFGLHGIPVFLVFRQRRPLGRITSWPGTASFVTAIELQLARIGTAAG